MSDAALAELQAENARLRKITEVLIARVEQAPDPTGGSAFALFYNNVTQEISVNQRTTTLTNLASRLLREIEQHKAAQAALRDAKAIAEAANESKTNFLAAVSHDLRQPLHAARLFLGEAAETGATGRPRDLIERAEAALEAMDDMLESLLDMARLDSGTWPVEPEIFSLNPLLERLTSESLAEAEAAGLRIRFCPTAAAIQTDRRLLERILRNFIGNALRWTERGGVLIGVRPRGEKWRIDVVDSGAGIPREKWRVIFQAFHQLGAPVRTASKGLGLGLAVVDRAARLIGAEIELDSRPGHGSRFSVTLPRATPPRAPNPALAAAPAHSLAKSFIVVLEDDPAVRESLCGLLNTWSCRVAAAHAFEAAREILVTQPDVPDAIIADYHLADGELGSQAVSKLRGMFQSAIPAMLISSDHGPHIRAAARAIDAVFIAKPVAPSKLRASLAHLLTSKAEPSLS